MGFVDIDEAGQQGQEGRCLGLRKGSEDAPGDSADWRGQVLEERFTCCGDRELFGPTVSRAHGVGDPAVCLEKLERLANGGGVAAMERGMPSTILARIFSNLTKERKIPARLRERRRNFREHRFADLGEAPREMLRNVPVEDGDYAIRRRFRFHMELFLRVRLERK